MKTARRPDVFRNFWRENEKNGVACEERSGTSDQGSGARVQRLVVSEL
jgi:hypothetical protein